MKALLITLAVLLGLVIAADRITPLIAEDVLAGKIRSELQLASDPDVSIHGFPFLTQAFGGEYDDIEITANAVELRAEGMPELPPMTFHANLYGVQVPFSDAISGSISEVPISRAEGSVTVPFDAIPAFIGEDMALSEGKDGAINIEGTKNLAGFDVQYSGVGRIEIADGKITVVGESVQILGQEVPDDLVSALTEELGFNFDIPALPFGLQITSARATDAGLQVSATGKNFVLGGAGVG